MNNAGAQRPEDLPHNKSDPAGDADPDRFTAISPTAATADDSPENRQSDAAFWGRTPTEPDLGDIDDENTYLPEQMPEGVPNKFESTKSDLDGPVN